MIYFGGIINSKHHNEKLENINDASDLTKLLDTLGDNTEEIEKILFNPYLLVDIEKIVANCQNPAIKKVYLERVLKGMTLEKNTKKFEFHKCFYIPEEFKGNIYVTIMYALVNKYSIYYSDFSYTNIFDYLASEKYSNEEDFFLSKNLIEILKGNLVTTNHLWNVVEEYGDDEERYPFREQLPGFNGNSICYEGLVYDFTKEEFFYVGTERDLCPNCGLSTLNSGYYSDYCDSCDHCGWGWHKENEKCLDCSEKYECKMSDYFGQEDYYI